MLGRFVQLVDFMVVEALIRINQESVSLIYEEMTKAEKKTEITTVVEYGDNGMIFNPTYEAFWCMLKDIMEDMVKVMEGLMRVVNLVEDASIRPQKKSKYSKAY